MKKKNGLTILIPVYNEMHGIESTIQHLDQIRKSADFDMEIILINDGSDDGTEEILRKLSPDDYHVINHRINRGYGAALKTGISSAKFDYIAITDADGTYPNKRMPEFFHEMLDKNLDMLVGARTGANVKIPLIRKPAKWLLNLLANYLTNIKIPDINSGLRIMRKSVVERFINILPDGFSFTTTITLAMLTNGYAVKYIQIDYNTREGKSKIRPIYDTLNFLQLIIRTVLYFDPLKIFVPLSGFFLGTSALMILYRLFVGKAFGVTSIIFFICGIQFLGLGMIADLIDKRLK
jgi:glycosyltransferase involved in cell wall biosynthesis